jgi:hypothetical protein
MSGTEEILRARLEEAEERERLLTLALRNLVELDEHRRATKRQHRKAILAAVALLHRGNE